MLKHALNISYYYSDFASIQVYTLAAKMDLKFDFFSKKKKKNPNPRPFSSKGESHQNTNFKATNSHMKIASGAFLLHALRWSLSLVLQKGA